MSDRFMNDMACGIEPECEGEEPTLGQWRARCRQLYRENRSLRGQSDAQPTWRDVPVTMEFLANFMDAYCGADGHNLVVSLAANVAKQKL